MADSLPTHTKDDTNSDMSSSYEAIALFSHACMTAVGFRLLGFGEDQKIGKSASERLHFGMQPTNHSPEAECARLAPRLPTQWNSSFGSHSLLYAHSQSSMQFLIKVDRLGAKAEIRGIGLGDEKITRFDITAKDFVSSAALPLRIPMNEEGSENREGLQGKLQEVFTTAGRSKLEGLCFHTHYH